MPNISPRKLNFILRSLPNFLWPLRWYLIKKSLKHVGKNFKFGFDSEFNDHRLIEVGNNVFMGLKTVINTTVPVIINDNVMFGRNVTIMGGDHNIKEIGKPMRFVKSGGINLPIVIEKDSWIGSNVIILKGVTIGEGAVIGAGSVVTKTIPPYSISSGNPCRVRKLRFNENELENHLSLIKSSYTKEQVMSLYNNSKL